MKLRSSETYPLKNISKKKMLLFKGIALLLPLIFLFLLECGLSIFNYGHNRSLFVEDPNNKQFLVMNRFASEKYFTQKENATIGNFEIFKKRKDNSTFRIFVLGESTTLGVPYLNNGSFHRWLKYRLNYTFPNINFEVINLSLTAVNSYTVLGFGKEIVKYEPDAVLIYCGQNEYYGALGVGSTSHIGNNPFLVRIVLKLKDLRLVQLIENTIVKIRRSFSKSKGAIDQSNLMKLMAADQHIVYGSKAFNLGIHQFESNLKRLCKILSKKDIPVFVSTLVSNEKDLKPFISNPTDTSASAQLVFEKANSAFATGNYGLAKQLFIKAKDLDELRFRAPEEMNRVIRNLTTTYKGVYLVDARAEFELNSPHGILGNETLLEHVHPNLYGYALLSDAFYNAMKKQRIISANWDHEMSFKELMANMPVTVIDSLRGAYWAVYIKHIWPFNEPGRSDNILPSTFEEKLAYNWLYDKMPYDDVMDMLSSQYNGKRDFTGSLKVAEAKILENPYKENSYLLASKLALYVNDTTKAVFILKRGFLVTQNPLIAATLIDLALKADQPDEAIPVLDIMVKKHTSQTDYQSLKNTVSDLVHLKRSLRNDQGNIELIIKIATIYLNLKSFENSGKYVKMALNIDNKNIVSTEIQKKLIQISNKN